MWIVETLNAIVDAEISALPTDMRAKLVRIADLIESVGLQSLPRDMVRPLDGKIWEIRIRAASGISRALYITAVGQRVIIVRVFVKKSQKTPLRELNLARERAKEVR